MGGKKYIVELSDEDRKTLEWFTSTGERRAQDNTRARILLKADDGLTDLTISEHVGYHPKPSTTHAKTTLNEGLRRFIAANPTVSTNASLTETPKPTSSNSPAANRQKDTLDGHYTSLPTNSLPSTRSTSSRSLTRPSDSG